MQPRFSDFFACRNALILRSERFSRSRLEGCKEASSFETLFATAPQDEGLSAC